MVVHGRYPWNLFGVPREMKSQPITNGGLSLEGRIARVRVSLRPRRAADRITDEIAAQVWLSRNYSADELLAVYASHVWLGREEPGIEAAAQRLFGERPDALDDARLALLMGMIQSPSRYDPIKSPTRALERRNLILERFESAGLIDADALARAKAAPLGVLAGDI
jgi:membrane peptidoglycan carboxypeptidase